MVKRGRTKGYYLPGELIDWLEDTASRERRSVSNYLATLIEREMRKAERVVSGVGNLTADAGD